MWQDRRIDVLLIEDEPAHVRLIEQEFAQDPARRFNVTTAATLEEGVMIMAEHRPDALLIDLGLPDSVGFEAFDSICLETLDIPVIVISSINDEERALEAMRLGAADYLVKGSFDHAILSRSIVYAIERKRSDLALKESKEKYRWFFENDLTGDFIESRDGAILSCNPAFVSIFGFDSKESAIGFDAAKLYRDPDMHAEILSKIRLDGKIENHEVEMKRVDGSPVFVIENKVGRFDDGGELVGVFGGVFDITEHRMLEEQLRQSQKLEAVGRLAGGIAHDFNNILTGILGYAELIEEEMTSESPLLQDVREIHKAASRAAELTGRLLAFSRRQVIAPESCDLNAVITNTAGLLRRIIGEHIELDLALDPKLHSCWADVGQIEQVVMNLVINSRDAMPDGGKLTIRTGNSAIGEDFCTVYAWAKPGDYACLAVTDTGSGIPQEIVEHIFEPFFTTKEVGKGTGLGLSTVYGIVKQHSGMVIVESEVGQGATFRVYFPVSDRNGAVEITATEYAPAGGSETILVVEDEEIVRILAKRILEKAGYRVLLARNGAEAVNIYKNYGHAIDLVITDVVMPQMGGIAACRQIREINPDAKVVLSSGYAGDAVSKDEVGEIGDAMVQKPYIPQALLETVRKVLEGG
jgi:PAS domain S-box-containing protein